jgi:hypothetical protein
LAVKGLIVAGLVGLIATATVLSEAGAQFAGKSGVVYLDQDGSRGQVTFNHKNHESRLNPAPNAVFKAKQGASCSGCHHTVDKATGIVQLWKCAACHKSGGDPVNPKGRDFDELWSKAAFHRLCIECHQASAKGPLKCDECHASQTGSN